MTQADPQPDLERMIGQVVGNKWRVVRLLGRGGMGAVFEAQNIAIGKRAALKFIDAEVARQPDVAGRFQREAEAASLVESAHIVQVFDSGTTEDGAPYIVMELLRGEDLRARLRRIGKLPPSEAVHIVAQTLRGLHRAHEAGIVHRDLKPDNIFLVDRDDDPLFAKIVDFGISKVPRNASVGTGTLTRKGVVLGTPYYMSPEQAQAFADVDARTDLWAVGAILFECLAGYPPFGGEAYEPIIIAICTTDAPDLARIDPTLPPALIAVVHRALRRDRGHRFQTAREMLEALQETGITPVSLPGSLPGPGAAFSAASGATVDPTAVPATVIQQAAPESAGASGLEPPPIGSASSLPVAPTRTDWDTGPSGSPARSRGATRTARAGLVLVGGAIMVAGFAFTLAVLRSASRGGPAPSAPPGVSSTTQAAGASGLGRALPEHRRPDPEPRDAALEAPTAPSPSASPAPVSRPVKRPSAGPSGTGAGAKNPGGVAGGLQIKTSYP